MPELPYFAGGQHTPGGACDFHCGACYRHAPGYAVTSLGGIALCATCHSLYERDVTEYRFKRMTQLRVDGLLLLAIGLKRR